MGSLMAENHSKDVGLYGELAMFLSQMNVFRGRGWSDSHELALLLQLYGGSSWVRRTGTLCVYTVVLRRYTAASSWYTEASSWYTEASSWYTEASSWYTEASSWCTEQYSGLHTVYLISSW